MFFWQSLVYDDAYIHEIDKKTIDKDAMNASERYGFDATSICKMLQNHASENIEQVQKIGDRLLFKSIFVE